MQLLLCGGYEVDPDGVISCSGDTATIALEEVQGSHAPMGLTLE